MNPLYLLKIDLKKMTSYRTFWVVTGLYFVTLFVTTASGMEFLKWLDRTFNKFGSSVNINRIPLYHFPDVWLNMAWWSGFFKLVLAIMVVISVTNEFAYRTLRQNIIDGMSRSGFLVSKVMTNLVLSIISVVMVFLIALASGLIYSPASSSQSITTDMEFFAAYFLELLTFLSYALLISLLVQRAGLTIILLLLSHLIELTVKENIDEYVPWLIPFFPMEAISNLVPVPLYRYAFQEIQDYIDPVSVAIAVGWLVVFNYLSYLKLKRSDL